VQNCRNVTDAKERSNHRTHGSWIIARDARAVFATIACSKVAVAQSQRIPGNWQTRMMPIFKSNLPIHTKQRVNRAGNFTMAQNFDFYPGTSYQ
jgi:hypothetical protein